MNIKNLNRKRIGVDQYEDKNKVKSVLLSVLITDEDPKEIKERVEEELINIFTRSRHFKAKE